MPPDADDRNAKGAAALVDAELAVDGGEVVAPAPAPAPSGPSGVMVDPPDRRKTVERLPGRGAGAGRPVDEVDRAMPPPAGAPEGAPPPAALPGRMLVPVTASRVGDSP